LTHRLFLVALATLAACGGSPPDDERPPLDGGTLRLASCAVDLTTRPGASVPELGGSKVGTDPTPTAIRLGVSSDPSTTMSLVWRTVDETTRATTVEYGVGSSLPATPMVAEGATFVYGAGFGDNPPLVRLHEAHLCGLQPDTEYSYRVGGGGTFSSVGTFRTAPAPTADEEVVIAVVGDTRNGYAVWASVIARIEEVAAPDLILFTGDAVTLGQYQPEWDEFFRVAEPTLRRAPMVATVGNHEAASPTYFSLLSMPGNEEDFSFDFGAAHITVVNDSVSVPADLDVGGRVAQFLDADLAAAAGRPWKLVMHHRATYSAAANHGSDEGLRAAFGPVFDAHHVDLVLNGHDHDYERSHPMNAGAVAASGTVYLVSGGAGATLYDAGTGAWTAKSEKRNHFVILRLRPARLELRAYDVDGTMFDELILTK